MNEQVVSRRRGAGPSATRRGLIVGAVMTGGALTVGCSPFGIGLKKRDFGAFGPFIRIAADGSVTVVNKHQEMGQGNHAGLAAIVAEELDADWDKVSVEAAPADAVHYGNTLTKGMQLTGGSTAINNSWDQLRQAGAAARAMFVQAAAGRWGVGADAVTVKDGVVSHAASGKSAGFGDLLSDAAKIVPPNPPRLKDPRDFTLIGTDRVRRKDSGRKSTGAERYTQDVQLPDMLTAMVVHPPRFGARPAGFDASAARAVPGVVDVVQIPSGVAVIARSTYAARKGREALKVTWNEDKAEKRSSDAILAAYRDLAAGRSSDVKAVMVQSAGDLTHAFDGETVSATYDFPYLAHAAMEPMNCVAQVDGNKVKLTFASQAPTLDQVNAALIVGTFPGAVEIEILPAGGSFGRRANPSSDYARECIQIAKHVGGGRPVKLVWTREDDMTGGRYRPLAHHAVTVKLGSDGYPAAWRHRIVAQSTIVGLPGAGKDPEASDGVKGSPYLAATPVVDVQAYIPSSPVTTLWWRSVGATHTAFAMEHTIDQLARKAGKVPADYRRAMYRKAGGAGRRHLAVLELLCEKAGWGQPPPAGMARGLAIHESFGSVVGQVAEVGFIDGEPRAHRVVCVIDCGIAVAPELIAAQMEGGICYGLSAALYGQITLKDGTVEQTNFDGYRVLRMNEAPTVETHIVPSGQHPTGVGEPGTPPVAPALANAWFALTGERKRALPLL